MSERILLVDSDIGMGKILEAALNCLDYNVTRVESGAEALELVTVLEFNLIITNKMTQCMSEKRFLAELARWPEPPPVLMLKTAPGNDLAGTVPGVQVNFAEPQSIYDFLDAVNRVLCEQGVLSS